jgi:hypothetical protein
VTATLTRVDPQATRSVPSRSTVVAVAALTAILGIAAVLAPNLAASDVDMAMSMGMTHYMELLGTNQPWNLLLFMGVPVVLAETLAISELALLLPGQRAPWVRRVNHVAGLVAGPAMLAISIHLVLNAVIPLMAGNGWRGPADLFAVLLYLAGVVPFVGITLVELGLLGRTDAEAQRLRAIHIAVFLVVAHVAMVFGMLDPSLLGYVMHH